MTEQAQITPVKRLSLVWLVPLIAIAVGAWIIYSQWQNQGPLITIALPSASGIEVNKTPIKVRDLTIGIVKKVTLNKTLNGVVVTARIDASAAHLLTDETDFWVVAPRISYSEVSGLNTLLSGSYIAMSASDKGEPQSAFVALPRPPITPDGTPGIRLVLTSDNEFAFKPGDPIMYKGFKVGEFEDAQFDIAERVVYYRVFITAPYGRLVTTNTRFWNTSGVKFTLHSEGIEIQTGSLETLLTNGVTFGVPEGMPEGNSVTNNASFTIYTDESAASDARYKLAVPYLIFIDETVRGLEIGAPVEYRGIEIGEVVDINMLSLMDGNVLEQAYSIPVLINIYPGKVRNQDSQEGVMFVQNMMRKWIQVNLRASLRMGNLLTGGLFVDLHHVEDAKPTELVTLQGYEVIPTVSNEFTQLTQKADAILDSLNQLPLAQLSQDIASAVTELKLSATSVRNSSDNFGAMIDDVDLRSVNRNVNRLLTDLSLLIRDFSNSDLDKNEIKDTLDTLQETMRSIQPLLQQLNQTPNGMIFSDNSANDTQPKAFVGNEEKP